MPHWPLHFFPSARAKVCAGPHLNAWLVEWKKTWHRPSFERGENRGPALQPASERAHFLPVRPPQVNFTLLKLNNPVTFSVIVSMGGPKNADHWGPRGAKSILRPRVSLKIPCPVGIPFTWDLIIFFFGTWARGADANLLSMRWKSTLGHHPPTRCVLGGCCLIY